MASVVGICNLALTKIGASPITSLDDDSAEARVCSRIYEQIRDEVMQIRPWASCKKRASLALLSDEPLFQFAYQFQLPTDYLNMVQVGDDPDTPIDHQIEGDKLLTDDASVNIVYVCRQTNSTIYEAGLIDLIATRMAVDLATAIASNAAMSQAFQQAYELKRQRAKAIDGPTQGEINRSENVIIDARL